MSGKDYSWLSLSRPRLPRITAYLEVKIWSLPKNESLTTYKKYCAKEEKLLLRSNFSSFPQYFQYIPNFKSPITHILLNVVNRIIFSSILQIWYFSKYGYLEVFQRVPWNSRVECIPFLQAVFLRRLRFFTHFVNSNLIKMFVSGEKSPYGKFRIGDQDYYTNQGLCRILILLWADPKCFSYQTVSTKTCLYNVDPFKPLLYSKTWVNRGIYHFSYIF